MLMKSLIPCLLVALATWSVHADEDTALAALQAADDLRVAATQSADRGQLEEILSGELHYAHSNGVIDTKESFIELVTSGRTKYATFDYEERTFSFPAPKIALMSGRARIVVEKGDGGMDSVLGFLAVWREEGDGKWLFLAWQSCRLPPKP